MRLHSKYVTSHWWPFSSCATPWSSALCRAEHQWSPGWGWPQSAQPPRCLCGPFAPHLVQAPNTSCVDNSDHDLKTWHSLFITPLSPSNPFFQQRPGDISKNGFQHTYTESRKMVLKNLFTWQQGISRQRIDFQTWGEERLRCMERVTLKLTLPY